MVRADRTALATGGLLARAALGFIGLTILVGWYSPPSGPDVTASTLPGDPLQNETTVTLRVPEGALAAHLTVVDATGRELAVVTNWFCGRTSVRSCPSGGLGVSYHLNPEDSAKVRITGTSRVTLIDVERDGRTKVSHQVAHAIPVPTPADTETATGREERPPFACPVGGEQSGAGNRGASGDPNTIRVRPRSRLPLPGPCTPTVLTGCGP